MIRKKIIVLLILTLALLIGAVNCICQLKSEPYVNLILHHLLTF
ncbi:hypothetical protein J2T56_002533 [Natronobacillus azotifigens]